MPPPELNVLLLELGEDELRLGEGVELLLGVLPELERDGEGELLLELELRLPLELELRLPELELRDEEDE